MVRGKERLYSLDGQILTFSFNTSDNQTVLTACSNDEVHVRRVRHFAGSPIAIYNMFR